MKKIILIYFLALCSFVNVAQTDVTQIEYAIDIDAGVGSNTLLNIMSGENITENILANIPENTATGYHKLFFRTKGNNGRWSQTVRKNIQIIAPQTQNVAIEGEYLLDIDPSYGMANTFTINPQTENITQAFLAQIPANTPIGYHKLYGRIKDSNGNWSQTFRKNIQVVANEIPVVIAIEYFFSGDPEFGNANPVTINISEANGSWTFIVPYPNGPYNLSDTLYVRAKDNNGKWSQTAVLDEVDPNLSINQLQNIAGVRVFPNPFYDSLKLKMPDEVSLNSVELYNLSGQLVYRSIQQITLLYLNELTSGLYLLKLNTNQGIGMYKIIKQ